MARTKRVSRKTVPRAVQPCRSSDEDGSDEDERDGRPGVRATFGAKCPRRELVVGTVPLADQDQAMNQNQNMIEEDQPCSSSDRQRKQPDVRATFGGKCPRPELVCSGCALADDQAMDMDSEPDHTMRTNQNQHRPRTSHGPSERLAEDQRPQGRRPPPKRIPISAQAMGTDVTQEHGDDGQHRPGTSHGPSERRAEDQRPQGRRPPPKRRPISAAIREIIRYQKSTELLITRTAFTRLVKQVAHEIDGSLRFQSLAISALQVASEDYLVELLSDTQLCSRHARRDTIQPSDMHLARTIQGDGIVVKVKKVK